MDDWHISQLLKKMAGMPPSMAAPLRNELAQRVKAQLERKPDNLHYRVLLARFYMAQDDYDAAQLQYRFIAEMLPEDDEAQAYFAQSLYLANQREITPEVQAAIDRALAINPHNATVLGMVGPLRAQAGVVVAASQSDAAPFQDALQAGDVIYAMNGATIGDIAALRAALDALPPGSAAVLQVERAGALRFVGLLLD